MRRILAVVIIIFVAILIAMLVFEPLRTMITNFGVQVLGPAIVNTFIGTVNGIIATLGLGGFAAITTVVGLIAGIAIHFFWVKADWKLRRWGSQRIAQDLGAGATTVLPGTPVGATTRPAVVTKPNPTTTTKAEEPTEKEKK